MLTTSRAFKLGLVGILRPAPGLSCLGPLVCALDADGRGELLLSATYFLIFATVLVNGGTCAPLLDRMGLLQTQNTGATSGLPTK